MKKTLIIVLSLLIASSVYAKDEASLTEAYELELINRVKSVFSPQPPGVRTIEDRLKRPVCATSIFLEAIMVRHRLSPDARGVLATLLSRPKYDPYPEYTYDSPAGHFKIHYTTSGPDAVYASDVDVNPPDAVPDYVNRCAEFFDYAWTYELDTLGYKEPPSDYFYPDSNGGDEKYDVYLLSMSYLGYTVPECESSPNFPRYTSYIGILNDFSTWAYLHEDSLDLPRVTAAHEFFHAIQMGYDGTELEYIEFPDSIVIKPYWMEMSAVWMEDMVYDQVNDYVYYLPAFFNDPWLSLKTFRSPTDLHAYGSCVWPMYLQERFDTTIIRDIWEGCAEVPGPNAIDYPGGESATDKALPKSVSFEDAFREFTVWNYFTDTRARTQLFYSEGDMFPKVKVDNVHHQDSVDWTSPNHPPENLGSSYVVFKSDPHRTGGIRINFDGHGFDYKVSALGYSDALLEPLDTTFRLNPLTMKGQVEIYNSNTYSEIVMIPAVTERSPDFPRIYEYQAEHDDSLYGEATLPQVDQILQNYPNPFEITSESDRTYFPFVLYLPSRVRIDIFTLSGERIKTIVPKKDPELWVGKYLGQHLAMPWDGRNEEGEYVSSGIYLYRFRTDRTTVIKKMAVIR